MQPIDIEKMSASADKAEKLLSLLANRNRLLILCKLTEGPLSVGELLAETELSQSALSQHLAKLRNAGIVETSRNGQSINYSLASHEAKQILEKLYEVFCADVD